MASGQVFGFIGGACAEPVVVREARHILAEGERFTRERDRI
jgi:xanthine/CO dehydrogenase XdhC/CoxF family maturation factor